MQGLFALFVYEGNLGSGAKAIEHFFHAIKVYADLNDGDCFSRPRTASGPRLQREREAVSWCMWGFYCCEWCVPCVFLQMKTGLTFHLTRRGTQSLSIRKQTRKPKMPKLWQNPAFPLAQPSSKEYWWSAYPMSCKMQRSMQVELQEEDVKLSEIVEDALDFLYPKDGMPALGRGPTRVLELYNDFLRWKYVCPPRIRFEEAVLPYAVLLQ